VIFAVELSECQKYKMRRKAKQMANDAAFSSIILPVSSKRWFYIWSDICCVGCKSTVVNISSRNANPQAMANPVQQHQSHRYVQLSCLHFLHQQCVPHLIQDGVCPICWCDVSQELISLLNQVLPAAMKRIRDNGDNGQLTRVTQVFPTAMKRIRYENDVTIGDASDVAKYLK
jgi:hypothetical protein